MRFPGLLRRVIRGCQPDRPEGPTPALCPGLSQLEPEAVAFGPVLVARLHRRGPHRPDRRGDLPDRTAPQDIEVQVSASLRAPASVSRRSRGQAGFSGLSARRTPRG